jgi:Family of unknown function (DUF6348)
MSDEIDVVQLAADVMERRGYSVVRRGTLLEHPDSGLAITPVLLDSYPLGTGSIHSMTAVTTSHPRLVPRGVFEYQHATAKTVAEAVREGFDQWVQVDFAVFIDALLDPLEYCQGIEFSFPQTDGSKLRRRAVLGPIGHAALDREPLPSDAEHPFCPCCFLTNTFDSFKPLMESDGFYGIRFFAARGEDGSPQADCRVNGVDWEDGKRALLSYIETWPQAGLEFRKQYVVMQTLSLLPRSDA